ncbi:hypothetical protein AGMMS50268_01260 [Spirochaetia bacterium]|nr:hypothetical protein AGMMS50268_01260 [Spirochaetia bacterium]
MGFGYIFQTHLHGFVYGDFAPQHGKEDGFTQPGDKVKAQGFFRQGTVRCALQLDVE